jgi:hypothetical protein
LNRRTLLLLAILLAVWPLAAQYRRGVNVSGAEFGMTNLSSRPPKKESEDRIYGD